MRIPVIIPIKGRGFHNHGSGLGFLVQAHAGSYQVDALNKAYISLI